MLAYRTRLKTPYEIVKHWVTSKYGASASVINCYHNCTSLNLSVRSVTFPNCSHASRDRSSQICKTGKKRLYATPGGSEWARSEVWVGTRHRHLSMAQGLQIQFISIRTLGLKLTLHCYWLWSFSRSFQTLKLGAHRACDCVIAAARLFARTQMSVCTGDRSHLVLASRGAVGIARIKMI